MFIKLSFDRCINLKHISHVFTEEVGIGVKLKNGDLIHLADEEDIVRVYRAIEKYRVRVHENSD